jgi:hypothetical protein
MKRIINTVILALLLTSSVFAGQDAFCAGFEEVSRQVLKLHNQDAKLKLIE